jgi:uncharacterized cupin superfamily protein
MRKNIVNISEVELSPRPPQIAPTGPAAERFDARVGQIAPQIGAKKLGYNLTAVPPGKRAYPFHSHRVNEEMFYVIEGAGEVRIGTERFPIRAGDIIACPTGGPETAHQIINDSDAELAYISVSTMMVAEICEYPDSGKIGAFGGASAQRLRHMTHADAGVDYWKGEV